MNTETVLTRKDDSIGRGSNTEKNNGLEFSRLIMYEESSLRQDYDEGLEGILTLRSC